jgi:hypothetical protein
MAPLDGADRHGEPLDVCGQFEHPGLATDRPTMIDWTGRETTADQSRIEAVLDVRNLNPDQQLLHVGIGNSRFAQRFASQVKLIDGLTVAEPEQALAETLSISNYTVYCMSKYSREFLVRIERRYDYIVDNNLASYACCRYHLYRMFDNYVWCLGHQGRILTDQGGMDWTVDDDPRWQLSYDDLVAIGARFRLTVARVTDTVYELRRMAEAERT